MKYKINEDIVLKLKNATTILSTTNEQRLVNVEKECRYFKSRKKNEMTIDKKIGLERLDRGEIIRVENGKKL